MKYLIEWLNLFKGMLQENFQNKESYVYVLDVFQKFLIFLNFQVLNCRLYVYYVIAFSKNHEFVRFIVLSILCNVIDNICL